MRKIVWAATAAATVALLAAPASAQDAGKTTALGDDLSAGFQVWHNGAHLVATTPLQSGEEIQVRYIGPKAFEIACNTQISRLETVRGDLGPNRVETVAFVKPHIVGLGEYSCQADGGEPYVWHATVSPKGEHAFELAPKVADSFKHPRGQVGIAGLISAKTSLDVSNGGGLEVFVNYRAPLSADGNWSVRLGAAGQFLWARKHLAFEMNGVDDNVPSFKLNALARATFGWSPVRWFALEAGPQMGYGYEKQDFSMIRLPPGTSGWWLNDNATHALVLGGNGGIWFYPTPGLGLGLTGSALVNANPIPAEPGNMAGGYYSTFCGGLAVAGNFASF